MSDYIDRGMRRARHPAPALRPALRDGDGLFARFGVQVTGGVVVAVGFRASACATLIAYCEVAAERVTGQPLAAAVRALQPGDLARTLPTVPPIKRGRAQLAAHALLSALLDTAKNSTA
jgi:NifU-like protein involved in Fe-S cluster formation